MDQTNNKLPCGWALSRLEEIAMLNPRHPSHLDPSIEVSFVPMPAVDENGWKLKSSQKRPLGEVRKGYTHFANGDVLVAKITPCMENGKAAVAEDLVNGLGCGTTELHVIRPIQDIQSKFLYHFVHSEHFRKAARQNMTGTAGQLRVPLSFLKESVIPVPPRTEQIRIVAKLEELLAKVDACRERLEKIPAILKRFRQSVLAAVCSGRLTADWRENDQTKKDAFTLLELNVHERDEKLKNECKIALNTRTGTPRPYSVNAEPIDYDKLDSLPDTWKWERLINLAHVVGGVTKGRKLKSGQTINLPYLRVANVQDGYIDFSEIKEIEALPEDLLKYRLKKGDILFTEGGDRDKLGRGTVWDGSIENCIHQNHIFRARLYCSKILPEFISLATKSEHSRRYFFDNASQTVNLASINKTTLGNLPIPIPPPEEQHEIVRRVEALFKIADDIEKRYQKAKAHVDKLTQSILAEAFRGKLVLQDPNDEPASELLKRIHAER